jgi:phospholipid/cholesterol/gamma-HCH transport system ATP-binding protein
LPSAAPANAGRLPRRAPAATPAIEVRNVSLAFDEKAVLKNISFDLAEGETLFLFGVTGTGKSVLLKVLLGLLKPDEGEVLIEGQNIVSLPEERLDPVRQKMGIVFQEGALFDSLSVYENVSYRLHEQGEKDEARIEQKVREMLRFVELEHAIDKMPSELSGGMRRRVAIARSIISDPSIMLYDSPTGGLDPITAHTINVLVAKLRDTQHVTSVLVTHRIQNAVVLSGEVYSPQRQALAKPGDDGTAVGVPATHFIVLRDHGIYFHGGKEELARSEDPYLQKFLE